jgi:hypothetical protein
MSLPVLSHSEADAFELCERRHYYAFGEKLARKTVSKSLQRGILGHEVLHTYFRVYQETNSLKAAAAASDRLLGSMLFEDEKRDTALELKPLLDYFFSVFEDKFAGWQIQGVEEVNRLAFPDFQFVFQVDLRYKEGGFEYILDWKFTYDFYSGDMQSLLPQVPRYTGALRALGKNIRSGRYGFIRYRNLKSTDPYDKFGIIPMDLSKARIESAFRDLILTQKKIAAKKAMPLSEWKDNVSRTANQLVCKSCSFASLCVAEANGSDGKVIRATYYKPSEYGYSEEES